MCNLHPSCLSGACGSCCLASPTRKGFGMFAGASASLTSPWFKVMQLRKTLYFHLNAVLRMFLLYLLFLQFYHLLLALSLSLLQMGHDLFPALHSHQQLELHYNLFLQVSFASALNPLTSASKGTSHCPFTVSYFSTVLICSLRLKFLKCLPFPSWNKCFIAKEHLWDVFE